MLHPKNNRLDYGEQLIAPEGYELNYAVGTTYSLDIEALMVVPVALFYSQTLDKETEGIRIDILDSLTKASNKISVFCQKGKIKVPAKYNFLMAYWEKGIEQICMPNEFSSFHPKVWVIQFAKEKSPTIYRVLITSRNLTFARDWDIAVCCDGHVGAKKNEYNQPLVDFLTYLESKGKRKFPKGFIQDLSKVTFDLPSHFDQLEFIPVGITANKLTKYQNPLLSKTWDDLLVISPFLDEVSVKTLRDKISLKKWIYSNQQDLDCISEGTLNAFSCKQFSHFITSAEFLDTLSEDNRLIPQLQNLHAKIYIGRNKSKYNWMLGSANCSSPSLQSRNIEFLVSLSGTDYDLSPSKISSILTEKKKDEITLFEEYTRNENQNNSELKKLELYLRKIIYELTLIPLKGEIRAIDEGTAFNLNLIIDASGLSDLPEGFTVRIKPLSEKNKLAISITPKIETEINEFTGYSETQLSPFIIWEIWEGSFLHKSFLVTMDIELPATRLSNIFRSLIDSWEKFLKYLNFLLIGDEPAFIENEILKSKNNSSFNDKDVMPLQGIPVFERLLIASSRFPKKIESIDKLIEYLETDGIENKDSIINDDFLNLWNIFKNYHQSIKK